jgi:hypothetical protein
LNPTAIFSKTGKGVQEASGKTSNLSRADRAVLKEIDGKTALQNIAVKFDKIAADKFDALIAQFDKDGYIREVSSGATAPQTPARSAPPPKAAPPKAAPPPASGGDDEMDFTQAIKLPPKAPPAPKAPPVDIAAASRAEADRKEKDEGAFDYKARQEAELKAKAQADAKAKADAEARARALAEAKARAENEAKAKAEADARARAAAEAKAQADADAKVKAAREAAIRMATEVKAKAEAEGKAKADELTGKLEAERKAREEAEKRASEAAERARKELEEKAKRDAEELRQRLEAEMRAKLDEERKAREEEDRKRREEEDRKRAEEDRKRREEDERRRKEEEARRAKEEAERKAREEEDRKRREEDERRRKEEEAERKAREEEDRKRRAEEDRKRAEEEKQRKEADERRRKEEEARRAKEEEEREAERKRRADEERKRAEEEKLRKEADERRAKDDAERRAKEDADRRAREDAERRAKDDAERRAKEEAESSARAARVAASQSASTPSIPPVVPPPAPPPPPPAAGLDSLLGDLDSFGKREEEEQKAKEEEERKAKEAAARKAKEEAERKAKEESDRKRREEEERKRKEDEERRAKEEEEKLAREEEEKKKQEEEDRKRKAKEALAAKEAERKAAQQRTAAAKPAASGATSDDDIGVTDDDLDMDDVKKDEKALSATARKAAREREQQAAIAAAPVSRPKKWGKPAAIALFVLLIGGVGALQLMPVSTADYEKAASEAMGVPVKIGSARLSVITGIEARFENVSVGDTVKIRTVRGFPEIGTLLGGKKSFSRIELEGASLSQSQLADAILGKVGSENFRVARVAVKQAKLEGPLTLPALDIEATIAGDGSVQSMSLRGGDKLDVKLTPQGSDIAFEISAGSLALPVVPALTLSDFGMKGTANRGGVTALQFDGRAFDGLFGGSARIRWGATWTVEGELRARGIRIAVFAPALVSEGKVEGKGTYTMSGANPATLFETARVQGDFKIEQGVLGSFDLTRALQTGGAQSTGRTVFTELTGQAVYDKGSVRITNASIVAGAMNAGASLDIDPSGGLSGRVVADVKAASQTLRATLNISGKIQDPVIRK